MTKDNDVPRQMQARRIGPGSKIGEWLMQPGLDVYTHENLGLRVYIARLYHRLWWTYWNRMVTAWKYRNQRPKLNLTLALEQVRPMDNLLWTLAVFSRTLRFVQTAADNHDRDGLVLSSCLANLLHNEPGYMLGYDPNAHWKIIPPNHQDRSTITSDLHAYFLERDISERLLPVCDGIFALDGVEAELGLDSDASDLDLAPPIKFRLYGHMLFEACLLIRIKRVPKEGKDFSEQSKCFLRLISKVARLLQPIPRALANWKLFDERAFRRATRPDWNEHSSYVHWFCMIFRPALSRHSIL